MNIFERTVVSKTCIRKFKENTEWYQKIIPLVQLQRKINARGSTIKIERWNLKYDSSSTKKNSLVKKQNKVFKHIPPDTKTPSELIAMQLRMELCPLRFWMKLPSGNFHCLMLSAEPDAIVYLRKKKFNTNIKLQHKKQIEIFQFHSWRFSDFFSNTSYFSQNSYFSKMSLNCWSSFIYSILMNFFLLQLELKIMLQCPYISNTMKTLSCYNVPLLKLIWLFHFQKLMSDLQMNICL